MKPAAAPPFGNESTFQLRLATIEDATTLGWHRARMFQDMGYIPAELFDSFRAESEARLRDAVGKGEYLAWVISHHSPPRVIAGAGLQLRQTLPHPIRAANGQIQIVQGRQGLILNVFTEPEWRRRGLAQLLMERIISWARDQRLDTLVLHASDAARTLYEQLGFVATNEMRFAGDLAEVAPPRHRLLRKTTRNEGGTPESTSL